MQTITNAISEIKAELPDYVTLVAVSKYHIPEKLMSVEARRKGYQEEFLVKTVRRK